MAKTQDLYFLLFIVFYFAFKSIFHFVLILVKGINSLFIFIFLRVSAQVCPTL